MSGAVRATRRRRRQEAVDVAWLLGCGCFRWFLWCLLRHVGVERLFAFVKVFLRFMLFCTNIIIYIITPHTECMESSVKTSKICGINVMLMHRTAI